MDLLVHSSNLAFGGPYKRIILPFKHSPRVGKYVLSVKEAIGDGLHQRPGPAEQSIGNAKRRVGGRGEIGVVVDGSAQPTMGKLVMLDALQ